MFFSRGYSKAHKGLHASLKVSMSISEAFYLINDPHMFAFGLH